MELVAVIALAWLMGITVLLGLCRAAARGDAALMAMRAERRRAPRLMPRRRSGCTPATRRVRPSAQARRRLLG
jgi:hypothetical protein